MSGSGLGTATGDKHLARAAAAPHGTSRPGEPPRGAARSADYAGRTTATYEHEQRGKR
ncbi:hypothetical protein [Streptomyces virginiae]|uniref:Uncharacterized protein n=1 Tax=Streptomyces virginiae TaxID=1961 RepID=A0ABZ1T407_STRVG|nr:hypothetical protein [Streptomyces virginiae]WTB20693.1 hypothetical protein OG253_03885 [Streptomyces virginiae]